MTAVHRIKINEKLKEKKFEEHNWRELVLSGQIKQLKVYELDKYLNKYCLLSNIKALKHDKIVSIAIHVLRNDSYDTKKKIYHFN